MPIVTIELTREGAEPGSNRVTAEQKAALFAGVAQLLQEVLGKPPEWTWVLLREVEPEDWGWGGLPVLEYRRRLAAHRSE
ncbi:tautomerase family protein [Rhizorhabdus argentea]|uniref:tautomerase family protein n=1 Tax=Rhizorhabdus argentea TaxID=1387174 RepID=UPI0030EE6A92